MTTTAPATDGTYCGECLADLPASGECETCSPSVPGTASGKEGEAMGLIGYGARTLVREAVREAGRDHSAAIAATQRKAQALNARNEARRAAVPASAVQAYEATLADARQSHDVARRDSGALERAQPQREPVDGAQLLTNVCKWLKRYLYLDSEAKYWALTLWVAGSHFRDGKGELVHEAYPIAGFLSDEPGSGKTHALDLLAILCPEVPGVLVEPSEAAVAALVGKEHVTLLLDEADVLFGAGARKSAIRALLNSGYRRGCIWPRVRK